MPYFLPFATPRTPKGYKHIQEPPSPLARFSTQPAPALPSLRRWKALCQCKVSSALFGLTLLEHWLKTAR